MQRVVTWFSCLSCTEIPPTGRKKENAAHCAGGREIYRALGETNAQRSPKAKATEEGSEERGGKVRKLSSLILAAENAAVFLNLLFFRLEEKFQSSRT